MRPIARCFAKKTTEESQGNKKGLTRRRRLTCFRGARKQVVSSLTLCPNRMPICLGQKHNQYGPDEQIQGRSEKSGPYCIAWASDSARSEEIFLALRTLSCRNTRQSYSCMDASGISMLAVRLHICPGQIDDIGSRSSDAQRSVILKTMPIFKIKDGVPLLCGHAGLIILSAWLSPCGAR